MRTTIYHNSRCSKSRECLTILNDFKEEVEVVNYLNQPLLKDDIEHLLELLQVEPQDIIRRNEAVFKEHFADKQLSRSEWIEAIVKYPILLERPIIVKGNKAIIGKAASKIVGFFSKGMNNTRKWLKIAFLHLKVKLFMNKPPNYSIFKN